MEHNKVPKRFLVCYDYGMGGLWAPIIASSAEEILAGYPELTVFDSKPPYLKQVFWDKEFAKPPVYLDRPLGTILESLLMDRGRS